MARVVVERNISYDDTRRRYYVTLDFGMVNGKQTRKVKTFTRLTDARKALRTHEAERVNGQTVPLKGTTVGQWLDYWMENVVKHKNQETTQYAYRQIIENHVKPVLGDVPIQGLKPTMVQKYYSKKGDTLSQNTVRKHHDMLRSAFRVAFQSGEIATNPLDKVVPPQSKRAEINFYNETQLRQLLVLSSGTRLEVPIKLGAYLGLRRGEICGLRWSNVDFDARVITIDETRTQAGSKVVAKDAKTKSSQRKTFIPDDLYNVLVEEHARQEEARAVYKGFYKDGNYVVVWDDGTPYRPNYLSEMFTDFIKSIEMPPITLHGLRHSFAAIANRAGVSLYDISKTLGHSSTSITSGIYIHVIDSAHQEAIQKVGGFLNSDNEK